MGHFPVGLNLLSGLKDGSDVPGIFALIHPWLPLCKGAKEMHLRWGCFSLFWGSEIIMGASRVIDVQLDLLGFRRDGSSGR